jgi:hypothetical protein
MHPSAASAEGGRGQPLARDARAETKRSDWERSEALVRSERILPLHPRCGLGASARGECADGDETFGLWGIRGAGPNEAHPFVGLAACSALSYEVVRSTRGTQMETKQSDWPPARHPVRTKRIRPLLPRKAKGSSARGGRAEGDKAFGSRAREAPNPNEAHPPVAPSPSWAPALGTWAPFGPGRTSRNPHGPHARPDLRTRGLPPTVPTAGRAHEVDAISLVDGVVACLWLFLRTLAERGLLGCRREVYWARAPPCGGGGTPHLRALPTPGCPSRPRSPAALPKRCSSARRPSSRPGRRTRCSPC